MNNCIFCKIITREISADIVYEDETALVFLDINPVRKGHVLIIPRQHHEWIEDTPDDTISHNFILTKKIIRGMKREFSCDYTLMVVEGVEVPHFHISIIPGYEGQPNATFVQEPYNDDTDKNSYIEKLKNAL